MLCVHTVIRQTDVTVAALCSSLCLLRGLNDVIIRLADGKQLTDFDLRLFGAVRETFSELVDSWFCLLFLVRNKHCNTSFYFIFIYIINGIS